MGIFSSFWIVEKYEYRKRFWLWFLIFIDFWQLIFLTVDRILLRLANVRNRRMSRLFCKSVNFNATPFLTRCKRSGLIITVFFFGWIIFERPVTSVSAIAIDMKLNASERLSWSELRLYSWDFSWDFSNCVVTQTFYDVMIIVSYTSRIFKKCFIVSYTADTWKSWFYPTCSRPRWRTI